MRICKNKAPQTRLLTKPKSRTRTKATSKDTQGNTTKRQETAFHGASHAYLCFYQLDHEWLIGLLHMIFLTMQRANGRGNLRRVGSSNSTWKYLHDLPSPRSDVCVCVACGVGMKVGVARNFWFSSEEMILFATKLTVCYQLMIGAIHKYKMHKPRQFMCKR